MGIIVFNGISSKDLGLVVQAPPQYEIPEKELTVVHVPGKNGDVIMDNGSYKNVERTYYIAKVFNKNTSFSQNALSITNWLHSAKGYARLEDTYEPEYYRMAYYNEENSMQNYYDVATVIAITFNCKPQRWLKSGDIFASINGNSKFTNPTPHDAYPLITVNLDKNIPAEITFTCNGKSTTVIMEAPSENCSVTLDCEMMEAYTSSGESYNLKTRFTNGIPVLYALADNFITSPNSSVKVKPRWWTI